VCSVYLICVGEANYFSQRGGNASVVLCRPRIHCNSRVGFHNTGSNTHLYIFLIIGTGLSVEHLHISYIMVCVRTKFWLAHMSDSFHIGHSFIIDYAFPFSLPLLYVFYIEYVRSEFLTTGNTKNAIFWDVAPCGSCKNRRLGGTSVLSRATLRNIP
jgi:hypothetical protein